MDIHQLGIQSWCFCTYKENARIIDALKQCKVDGIELCGVHIDVNAPEKTLQEYRDAGIRVTSFGVHGFTNDEKAARKVFELAVLAGFPTISAVVTPDSLELMEKLCAEYGKKLAIHNHGRRHDLGSVRALDELFHRTGDNIGLCLDTAWMLDSGENPLEVAKKFRSRLYGTHIKDFVFTPAGTPEDVIVGTGNLPLRDYLSYLAETGYDGYLTLEYEGDKENPVPALSRCVDAIKAAAR